MTNTMILLRQRLAWVQGQLAKEMSITDPNVSQKLIIVGRVDAMLLEKVWLVDTITQLEQEEEGR